MRIGLNTLFLVPGKMGGSEIYVRGLIQGLSEIDQWTQYIIFANQENVHLWGGLPDNFSTRVCPVKGSNKVHRTIYERFRLNREVGEERIHVLHSLGSTAPPPLDGVQSIVTIADIIFLRYPKEFGLAQRLVAKRLVRDATVYCDHIITVSEFSRRDLQKEFGVSDPGIDVTLEGCRDLPRNPREAADYFRSQSIPEKFIFSVAASYYHKNLAGLLRGFRELRKKYAPGLTLVISGLKMAAHAEYMQLRTELGLEKSVIFTGWVSDSVLRALYERASCFVFPSLYEGFGLPVLEAMALGTPVVCSNATSLPEVAGDAAIMVNPLNEREMADAIWRCLSDSNQRSSLIAKGRKRAAQFTWQRCARETLEVYKKLWDSAMKGRRP